MQDETTKTKKPPTPKTKIGEFPMGECTVTVTRRGDHPVSEQDLRRGAVACREMATELEARLTAKQA